jgi:hypothetical protein
METPQVQKPVRWHPGNEESGRPIRDNMDVEGVSLEWNIGEEKEDRLPPQDGKQESATATSPKRLKKLKMAERTTLLRCDGGVDRRLRQSLPFNN